MKAHALQRRERPHQAQPQDVQVTALAHLVHELTCVVPGPIMSGMRSRWLRAIGLLTGATVLATLICPCAMVAAPAVDAHGCCPVEPGLRAAAPSCCAATAAPEPGTATPSTAGPALPLPAPSVLATLPAAAAVTPEAPQVLWIAASPPSVLRI